MKTFFWEILYVDHFNSLYWIFYNVTSVLCFAFLATRHVLAPWPGVEPTPPALEGKVLTTVPPGKAQVKTF